MSLLRKLQVTLDDGPNLDPFSRLRVSNVSTLFDCQFTYGLLPLIWLSGLTGTGTATHLPNESSVRMRCTTTSGDKVIRQSKRYTRYQPGKGQLIILTGVMGAKKANVLQRIGIFDDQNGLFFEQDETNLKVVRRTYTSGSIVDNAVNQSSWNLDKLDGTGVCGITIDMSKTQIFIIDYQWLGVGRVRMGFDIDGKIYYCHEFLNANSLTTVYMTTPNLPIRYSIENTGTTASTTDMIQICASVVSEGGFTDERGITHVASNGTTGIGVTTRRPILSIRPKTTFNSITNRAEILPVEYELYAATNSVYFEIVLNGTLTGASWTDVDTTYSPCEQDVSATAISGGTVLDAGFIPSSGSVRAAIESSLVSKLSLSNNIAGNSTDIISIVCTSFTGTSTISGKILVKELY